MHQLVDSEATLHALPLDRIFTVARELYPLLAQRGNDVLALRAGQTTPRPIQAGEYPIRGRVNDQLAILSQCDMKGPNNLLYRPYGIALLDWEFLSLIHPDKRMKAIEFGIDRLVDMASGKAERSPNLIPLSVHDDLGSHNLRENLQEQASRRYEWKLPEQRDRLTAELTTERIAEILETGGYTPDTGRPVRDTLT